MARQSLAGRQRGAAMIGFALALVPLLALLALLIDVGAAGYITARLESVTDAAALEGPAGWRDPNDPAWCLETGEPGCNTVEVWAAWDAGRRLRAGVQAAEVFGIGDDENLRVGPITAPVLELDPGLSDPSLRALITSADAPRLAAAPIMQPNSADLAIGDIVGGTWLGATPILVPSCLGDTRFEPFDENCRYERADFVPGELLAPTEGRRAFLVRLRLTDEEPIPGVASPGGRLPALFGRLADSRLRQSGIAARGTAIADARPALSAGRAGAVPGLPGAAPLVVDAAWWETVALDSETTLEVAGASLIFGGTIVGQVLAGAPGALYVGDAVTSGPTAPAVDGFFTYLGLYRTTTDGIDRITGFANATLAAGAAPDEIVVAKLRSSVAPGNASAVVSYGLDGLDPAVVDSVFLDYRSSNCLATDPLATVCVAVLVR